MSSLEARVDQLARPAGSVSTLVLWGMGAHTNSDGAGRPLDG
jgi:hypothetical protein